MREITVGCVEHRDKHETFEAVRNTETRKKDYKAREYRLQGPVCDNKLGQHTVGVEQQLREAQLRPSRHDRLVRLRQRHALQPLRCFQQQQGNDNAQGAPLSTTGEKNTCVTLDASLSHCRIPLLFLVRETA